ncbi:MAG: cobalamin-binding protein [Anaerolineae bacterium]|nr:cobalamin-binding protein [Anaerolineae bacterium]
MSKYKEISQTLLDQKELLAEQIVRRQYDLQPILLERYGQAGWNAALRDQKYHLTYLAQTIAFNQAGLFVNYIEWSRQVLEAYGLTSELFITTIECTQEILAKHFDGEQGKIIRRFLQTALARLQSPPDPSFSQPIVDENQAYGKLAKQYLETLLVPDRSQARRLILDAVKNGVSVKDIYLNVFQPVQHEIGRLWQTNQISVAQEHYATAVTQQIMSQLYEHIFATPKTGKVLVAACVGDELHEIGIRMVTDLFEMAGWDTFYLGANTPAADIIQTINSHQAHLLAASVTLLTHLDRLEELIVRVRNSAAGAVKILVGGYPFNLAPNLWREIGADGSAPDAETGILVAQQLCA